MGSSIFFFDATLLATANRAGEGRLSPPGQSKPSLGFLNLRLVLESLRGNGSCGEGAKDRERHVVKSLPSSRDLSDPAISS